MPTWIGDFDFRNDIDDNDPDTTLCYLKTLAAAEIGDRWFVFVGSYYGSAIQIMEMNPFGVLTVAGSVSVDDFSGLGGVSGVSAATISGAQYLIDSGQNPGALNTFRISVDAGDTPVLTHVQTLATADLSVTTHNMTMQVANRTYVIANGRPNNA